MNSLKDGLLVLLVALWSLAFWLATGIATCLVLLTVFAALGVGEKETNVLAGLVTVGVGIGTGILIWSTVGKFVMRRLGS